MTPPDLTAVPTFRPGDRLAGTDLTAWGRVPLAAPARHFRHLHRVYGVVDGLRVTVRKGDEGTWRATVSAGTAYDPLGRLLAVPQGGSEVVLPAAGADGRMTHLFVLRGGEPEIGPLGGVVPTPRPVEFALVPVDPPGPWDVPLAGLTWTNGVPTTDQSYRATAARGFRRPFVATGSVPAGTTAVALPDGPAGGVGWQVWVDTTAAGFLPDPQPPKPKARKPKSSTRVPPPVYVAAVGRPTAGDAARLLAGVISLPGPVEKFGLGPAGVGPSVLVSEPRADGFMLTVRYPVGDHPDLVGLRATPLDVRWVGVEVGVEAAGDGAAGGVTDDPNQSEGIDVVSSRDPTGKPPTLRWPEFLNGRLLTAEALNELQASARELLRLHNRTLHDWGVADGCGVVAAADRRAVEVAVGYALDRDGRELIVTAAQRLAVPASVVSSGTAAPKTWWVAASYTDGDRPQPADPGCRPEAVPLVHQPDAVVRWRDPLADGDADRLRPGLDVILATVTVEQGRVKEVTATGRRSAVPGQRPYLFAGRRKVSAGRLKTAKDWPNVAHPVGKVVTIDTRAGGFTTTPHYLITVEVKGASADLAAALGRPVVVKASNLSVTVVFPGLKWTPAAPATPVVPTPGPNTRPQAPAAPTPPGEGGLVGTLRGLASRAGRLIGIRPSGAAGEAAAGNADAAAAAAAANTTAEAVEAASAKKVLFTIGWVGIEV